VKENSRPDPDELLASINLEEERSKRGKLKIFFGMCAGVGKTYSMLKVAQVEKTKGIDVVIGYIETHERKETIELTHGLEMIPRVLVDYRGTSLQEVDIDTIVARRPDVVLIDELAHTNAPGSRHLKRYQDVMEILDTGINVYTTLNVQHLESRSETVSQITGIIVRETLPDEIFEIAEEIELVDLTPDELLQRFSDGKVYAPDQSKEAIQNFFRKGNITALREMALRIVADRVDIQLRKYMQQKRISGPWKSGLRLMAVIGPNTQSVSLLRWAKNLSYTMGASILALYVEPAHKLSPIQQEKLTRNINLAKKLGAEFISTSGDDFVKAILNIAHKENITHIFISKPRHGNILSLFRLGKYINKLVQHSGNIDVYVMGSNLTEDEKFQKYSSLPSFTSGFSQYFLSGIITIALALAFYPFKELIGYQVVSFAMLFMISVLAVFYGIGPILLSATLCALCWNYFFIPPAFTLHIDKAEDILMLVMFFTIALLNGILTTRVRKQEKLTRDREERTNALYQLTRDLSLASGIKEVVDVSVAGIKKFFKLETAILLQGGGNELSREIRHTTLLTFTESDWSVATWTFFHSGKAGRFTDTLPSSPFTFYPLMGSKLRLGVIAVKHLQAFKGDEEIFWDTFKTQVSNALEREFLNDLAMRASILNESEKLYKTLFDSISHELKIPVATIMGASDTLLSIEYDKLTYQKLNNEIFTASERLNRLIENLLNMSRLESERIKPHADWHDVHDLANKVILSLKRELQHFRLEVVIPDNMPFVKIDFGLMEQVLHNLVFNATQYARHNTTIRIKMYYDSPYFYMQVMDRGPGFPPSAIPYVFDKFYRVEGTIPGGTGLGLSIVKGFVEAQGGSVKIENRQNGGACITVKISSEIPNLDLIE
jgi:two-component system, OmpR family, sensor histidine kinase KdpD